MVTASKFIWLIFLVIVCLAPTQAIADGKPRNHDCRDIRRVVGDQHLTVDGARKSANDAWAATIRFHMGEKFMDLANAKHISYLCSRSSIKEGGVTTLGQTLTRCEVRAMPCAAQPEESK